MIFGILFFEFSFPDFRVFEIGRRRSRGSDSSDDIADYFFDKSILMLLFHEDVDFASPEKVTKGK